MVLAGLVIAVGVVVDDAIIDVENIVRRLREHRAEGGTRSTASIVLDASLEVRSPIVYATLIILAAVIPVFFLTGLMGSFFQPLALSYTLAVSASMLVAVTVTPAMALILLRKATLHPKPPPVVRWSQAVYTRLLRPTVRRPLAAYVVVAALFAGGIAVVPRLGQDLLPTFRERDFLMHWVLEPSASYDETMAVTKAASRELRAVPGVRNFGAHVGQAVNGDEVYGIYFVENWISIDPDEDYDETLGRVQSVVDGYPGLRRDVQTYLKERIREVLTGAGEAVVVRVYGDELDVIEEKAHEIEEAIASDPRGQGPQHGPADADPAPRRPGRPGQGAGGRPEAGRRAPAGRCLPGRPGAVRRLPGRQGVRRHGVERPGSTAQPRRRARHAHRHPVRGDGAVG